MPARNPAQVNRMLGGSPPGVPPANAFDMDPAELERMLSEGWTMFEDGTMAPPAVPGGMNLGATTGYDEPTPMAGPSLAETPVAPASPVTDPAAGLGGPSLAPAMASVGPTPPGVAPIEPTPPPPDLGGVASALPDTPIVSTGVGRDRGPSAGLGLERGGVEEFFGDEPVPPVEVPTLDPFGYVQEQNRVSAQPSINRTADDPGGYIGGDVVGRDPTNLLPPRRRRNLHGPPTRLNVPDARLSEVRRPMPPRRP